MTEKQYEKALQALGAKNVTTERQRNNGTTAFKLPTGQVVSEHKTGYIRRNLYKEDKPTGVGKCYQLNPTYDIPHKAIGQNGQMIYLIKLLAKTVKSMKALAKLE
jgi:hypothetical protein